MEGALKPGFRHNYQKRIFYFDEDAPGTGLGDNYDASGKVYRTSINTFYPMYEAQTLATDSYWTIDLQTGIYAYTGEVAETGGWFPVPPKPDVYYSSEALAGEGIR